MTYQKSMNDMTESEQKCYMINSLAAIKDAINAQGGNVTDSTPYADYASKIAGTTVIEAKSITPSTEEQTITASGSVDGFSPITVAAVTAAIDENIVAENIKAGVTILGVEGTYTGEQEPL